MKDLIFIDNTTSALPSLPPLPEGGSFFVFMASSDEEALDQICTQLKSEGFKSLVNPEEYSKAYLVGTNTNTDLSIINVIRSSEAFDGMTFIKYNQKTEGWISVQKLLVITDSSYQEKISPPPLLWNFAWKRDGEEMLDVAFANFNFDNITGDDLFKTAHKIVLETAHRISKFQNVFVDLDPALSFLVMHEIVQNPLLRGVQLWYPVFQEGKAFPRWWKKIKFKEEYDD